MGAPLEDVHRIGLKLFAADGGAVRPRELVPIFHRWIQTGAVANHMLIDVADYQHVPDGPGVLLVAHEANFSLDGGGGRTGWLYLRKRPLDGALPARVRAAARACLATAELLEQDAALAGRLRFRADELEIVANDRLRAPNTPAAERDFAPVVRDLLAALYGNAECVITPQPDRRERLGVHVRAAYTGNIGDLLKRL
jgi:hypothetical protein